MMKDDFAHLLHFCFNILRDVVAGGITDKPTYPQQVLFLQRFVDGHHIVCVLNITPSVDTQDIADVYISTLSCFICRSVRKHMPVYDITVACSRCVGSRKLLRANRTPILQLRHRVFLQKIPYDSCDPLEVVEVGGVFTEITHNHAFFAVLAKVIHASCTLTPTTTSSSSSFSSSSSSSSSSRSTWWIFALATTWWFVFLATWWSWSAPFSRCDCTHESGKPTQIGNLLSLNSNGDNRMLL